MQKDSEPTACTLLGDWVWVQEKDVVSVQSDVVISVLHCTQKNQYIVDPSGYPHSSRTVDVQNMSICR